MNATTTDRPARRGNAARVMGSLGVVAAAAAVAGLGVFGSFTDSTTPAVVSIDNGTAATIALAALPTQKNTLLHLADTAYGLPALNGLIAHFRLFNRELTGGELTTLYNAGTRI